MKGRFKFKLLPAFAALSVLLPFAELVRADEFLVPLSKTNGWQILQYRNLPPNTFHSTPSGFGIGVTNSAAPAVFPLANQVQVTELKVRGRISGSLNVSPAQQGQKGFDDYTVRVGLVEPGSRTLNWGERLVAADWVKKLFALAPRGLGISQIHFFNVGTDSKQTGRTRAHPLSDLMQETVVAVPEANGRFAFTNRFSKPLGVVAIWISCDGDDTKSSYSVTLEEIALEHKTP